MEIEELEKALEDKDAAVRRQAVQALGEAGRDDTVDLLEKSLADADKLVRSCATYALKRLRPANQT